MRKTQELSLNLIVVGSLALLVLLIIGGILIFGGGDLLSGLTNIGASDEEVRITSFLSTCQSRCNTLNLVMDASDLNDGISVNEASQLRSFCCEASDLDQSGEYDNNGGFGGEICALAYDQCTIDGIIPNSFCKLTTAGPDDDVSAFDYTTVTTAGCNLN